ncbi:MAG: hypothetical protein IJW82_00455 [Clostridia bacterium]|nr:hypothetical protein [Clostridia bacterium]
MIKSDLHLHLEENAKKEDLIKLLQMAEKEEVKGLGVLSYNSLDIYAPNGIFCQVLDEGIKKYYSGKIVSAVEMVCQIDNVISPNNFDYYGYRADVCLYDFDYEKLKKYFLPQTLKQNWIEDFETFKKLSKNLDIEIPSIDNFTNDYHPLSFVEQLMAKYPEIIKQFSDVLGIEINIASDLTRNHITNPKGKLFFEQKLFPKVSDILKMAKECNSKVALAHPAYMNKSFDTKDYIESLINFSRSNKDFKEIEYICGDYMLNTQNDRKIIKEMAQKLNVKLICGSDMRLIEKMFYLGELSQERVYYTPRPGFSIAKEIETKNGDLMMKKEVLDEFNEFTGYNK